MRFHIKSFTIRDRKVCSMTSIQKHFGICCKKEMVTYICGTQWPVSKEGTKCLMSQWKLKPVAGVARIESDEIIQ